MNDIDNALTQFAAPKFTTVRENGDGSVSLLDARGVEMGMASVSVVQKYENHLRCKALNAGISKWWHTFKYTGPQAHKGEGLRVVAIHGGTVTFA